MPRSGERSGGVREGGVGVCYGEQAQPPHRGPRVAGDRARRLTEHARRADNRPHRVWHPNLRLPVGASVMVER